jgi:hypothetical protein
MKRALLILALILLPACARAAVPTTRPVFSNIAAPGATRWAWPWQGLVYPVEPKPDLDQWRKFFYAVRDNKPLHRDWAGRDYKWWDETTTGILLDAEAVTSSERYTLAEKMAYLETVARSCKTVAPKLSRGFYDDASMIFAGRTRYPWSADLIGEALERKEISKRLHGLCDYIVFGSYYSDRDIATPAAWTEACATWADNARMYALLYPDKPRLWLTMSFCNTAWSRPKREGETDEAYRLALAPSREQIVELREAVAPTSTAGSSGAERSNPRRHRDPRRTG